MLVPGDSNCLAEKSKCHLMLGQLDEALQDAEASLVSDRTFGKVWAITNALVRLEMQKLYQTLEHLHTHCVGGSQKIWNRTKSLLGFTALRTARSAFVLQELCKSNVLFQGAMFNAFHSCI